MARRLDPLRGLVLFNRLNQPGVDLHTLEMRAND
jgi:hypothetical protein